MEGIERAGDETFHRGSTAGAGFGILKRGGSVVDFALDFVGGRAGHGVPDQIDGTGEVAGADVEVLRDAGQTHGRARAADGHASGLDFALTPCSGDFNVVAQVGHLLFESFTADVFVRVSLTELVLEVGHARDLALQIGDAGRDDGEGRHGGSEVRVPGHGGDDALGEGDQVSIVAFFEFEFRFRHGFTGCGWRGRGSLVVAYAAVISEALIESCHAGCRVRVAWFGVLFDSDRLF